jgi:hypothetical protein
MDRIVNSGLLKLSHSFYNKISQKASAAKPEEERERRILWKKYP